MRVTIGYLDEFKRGAKAHGCLHCGRNIMIYNGHTEITEITERILWAQYQESVESVPSVVEKDRVTEEHLISVKSVQSVVEKKDFCGLCVIKESGESGWWEEAK